MITVAILAPLFAALLFADRVALIYATNRVARQIEGQGFPAKPQVSIAGFPFLTQVAARRLNKVVVSAAGKKLGPVEPASPTLPPAATAGKRSGPGNRRLKAAPHQRCQRAASRRTNDVDTDKRRRIPQASRTRS